MVLIYFLNTDKFHKILFFIRKSTLKALLSVTIADSQ